MFSSEDVAQSIEEYARNKSYTRFKNSLPRMKKQDIQAAFYYVLTHQETELLDILVHNASDISKDQKQRSLIYFVDHTDVEKIRSLLDTHPGLDAADAMLLSGTRANFKAIKALLPYAPPQSIDRAFEYCMESGDWRIVKFLLPHISNDGDHVNSLIYASDFNRQDVFDVLYTISRAQQAFKNIKLLDQGAWSEGYNIKPIKDRLEMDLQNQRIHAQLDTKTFCPLPRKL